MLRKLQVDSNQLLQHQFASNDQDSPLHVRSWFSYIFFRIIFVIFSKMLTCHSALGLIFLTTKLFVLRKLYHVRCWFPVIIFEKHWKLRKNNIDKLVFRISNVFRSQLSLARSSSMSAASTFVLVSSGPSQDRNHILAKSICCQSQKKTLAFVMACTTSRFLKLWPCLV